LKRGTSGYLLKEAREVKSNPFINLIYEVLVYRFLMLENQLEQITFLNSTIDTLPIGDKQFSENHLKMLIERLYDSIVESTFLQIMPSMKTDKKVADLFCKAMTLVLNGRFVDNAQFASKISDLFNSEVNLQSQLFLKEKDYTQLDIVFNIAKSPLDGLNSSNTSMLFHLLKEYGVIQNLNNNQLALIISLLTGKSTQKLSRSIGESSELKSYKSQISRRYTAELIPVLENILKAIKK
jgi:hypothetical protein